jgi:hypothetical protein
VAVFVTDDVPTPDEDVSDDDASEPDRKEVLQELWSDGCMSDLFTALKPEGCASVFATFLDSS